MNDFPLKVFYSHHTTISQLVEGGGEVREEMGEWGKGGISEAAV